MNRQLKRIISETSIFKRFLTILVLASMIMLIGCGAEERQQAKDLVKVGNTVSTGLADFYGTMATRRAEWLQLYEFKQMRSGAGVPADIRESVTFQIEALKSRAKLAKQLDGVYSSLGKLIDYDAPGEITGAALDLKAAIEEVSTKKLSIPGFANVDPNLILKPALNAIVSFYQIKKFEKNAPKAAEIVSGIVLLYRSEMLIYKQINLDYYDESHRAVTYLIRQNELGPGVYFDKTAQLFGLRNLSAAMTDATTKAFLLSQVDKRETELSEASVNECEKWKKALELLHTAHRDLFKKQTDSVS